MSEKVTSGLKVPFGRLGDKLVAPADYLERGLACGCVCPGCGALLLLRQGKKRRHFAHFNAPGSNLCVERSIHSAAIQVLMEAKHLLVPGQCVSVSRRAEDGTLVERVANLSGSRIIRFDECKAEVTFSQPDIGTIRPDVVGYKGNRQLLVEMWFTHAVDLEKRSKLERYGLPALEIYLGDLDMSEGFLAIEKRVLDEVYYKEWLFYPHVGETKSRLQGEVDKEVARLNEKYAKRQAEQRHRAETRAAQLEQQREKREEERRRRLAEIEPRFAEYRLRTNGDKERHLRRQLSMTMAWPYYLRLDNPHNRAIDAPHKIWQAAVFHKFIYRRPLDGAEFTVNQVCAWVRNWFGEVPGTSLSLPQAIFDFLSYLKGCGFIKQGNLRNHFFVLHAELAPPDRRAVKALDKEVNANEALQRKLTPSEHSAIGHLNDKVTWADNWPDYEVVKTAITKWISMSQREELKLLDIIYRPREELPTPFEFAMHMHQSMPLVVVFNFLRNHRFVN